MLDNFSKKLKKLDNYFVLQHTDEYFIVATTKIFKEHIEVHNTFSTYATNRDREIWTFFILTIDDGQNFRSELAEFAKRKVPIILMPKDISNRKIETIEEYLDVQMNFILRKDAFSY